MMIVNGLYEEAGGVATSYYTFGGQRPSAGSGTVAMRVAGAVYWLHGDHLGSASLTTNAGGQKVAELRYLPFGETRWAWGVTPTDRRYTGQRELAGVGLYDYNARMYWPAACPERSRRGCGAALSAVWRNGLRDLRSHARMYAPGLGRRDLCQRKDNARRPVTVIGCAPQQPR